MYYSKLKLFFHLKTMKNTNDFLLTEIVTVGQAKQWMRNKDDYAKANLIKLIHHRFYNRYVKHLKTIDSGFLKMAISCLMIETMESFRQGLKDTKGIGVGKKMFEDFFIVEEPLFPGFREIAPSFYSSIRCGILHQAETTNGWRIVRSGTLLDKSNRTINATRFVNALEKALDNYINNLKVSDISTTIWKHAILKIEDVCENCKIAQ